MVCPNGSDYSEGGSERSIARPPLRGQVLKTGCGVGIVRPRNADRDHEQRDRESEDSIAERLDPCHGIGAVVPDCRRSPEPPSYDRDEAGMTWSVVERASGVKQLFRIRPA